MIQKIEYRNRLLALVVRASYEEEGVNFLTPNDNPLQLGVLKHRQGTAIRPHTHRSLPRVVEQVQEVLHVARGEIEVSFYGKKGKRIRSTTVRSGDTILLVSGGHGFSILKDSKIIEVKQGPYYGPDEDKQQLSM